MTVFIPAKKNLNPFFDEIMFYSKTKFHFGNLDSSIDEFSVILIHWPEQLFDWREPTEIELQSLENKLKYWKLNAHIIYAVHNLKPNFENKQTANYEKLYTLIIDYCDTTVHFGNFSLNIFKVKYPKKNHEFICHPLYYRSYNFINKNIARRLLGISKQKLVIIAPGRIRSVEERNILIKSFEALADKNKLLIVPYMLKKKVDLNYKIVRILSKVINIKLIIEYFYNKTYRKEYRFDFNFSSFEKISLVMSAADIVFIPRMKTLNSGNVFLGLSFKKIIVGPCTGNITEILHKFKFPTFNPEDLESACKALKKAVIIYKQSSYIYENDELNKLSPSNIAEEWDRLIKSIIGKTSD